MRKIYPCLLCLLSVFFFTISCEQEPIEITDNSIEDASLKERKKFMKEASLLMGRVLVDRSVRDEVLSKMEEVDIYDELTSFSYLLSVEKSLKKSEVKHLRTGKASFAKGESLFRAKLINEVSANLSKYSYIASKLESRNIDLNPISSKSDKEDFGEGLAQLMANEDPQILYPYEKKL